MGELGLDLCRAVVAQRLETDERVELEHHAVLGHLRLTQSVLKEPEQEAVSLFLTDRRLIRVRSRILADRPFSCDEGDQTRLDGVPLEAIAGLEVERTRRLGEAAAGAVIFAGALLLGPVLAVTGPILAAVGLAGIAHALLLPTRTLRLLTTGGGDGDPFLVHAPRARSARRLAARLRGGVGSARQSAPEGPSSTVR